MRTLLSILALFSSLCGIAQSYSDPACAAVGRELPRDRTVAYPSREEAEAGSAQSAYLLPITEWEQSATPDGTRFTTHFTVPFAWVNRQVLFRLSSASGAYSVQVNGKQVGYTQNGHLPAEFNLTKASHEGRNTLSITLPVDAAGAALESWNNNPEPRLGSSFVVSQPTIRLRDLFVKTRQAGDGYIAEVAMIVKSDALNPKTARIHYELRDTSDRTVKTGFQDITLSMRGEDTLRFVTGVPQEMLWSAESPTRYDLLIKTQIEGRNAEFLRFRPGFRTVAVDGQGILSLNGSPIALRAREASPDLTAGQIERLKAEGINTLALLPGAVREGFYDDCDRIGIYVVAQAPLDTSAAGPSIRKGGNPSNQPVWRNAFIDRTQGAYLLARRHPSVLALSMARNSANGINLYESYLGLKAIEDALPIVYPGAAGQWNSDKFLPITNRATK